MSVNKVNQSTGELSPISGGTLYADAPVGSIQAYGGSSAPWGWLLCQGQAISRATYAELFNVIGTSFGSGDGSTTFNVPDLRGEFLRGAGTNSHSGQGSGGSVGTHQNATFAPAFYNAGSGTTYVVPGRDASWSNPDSQVAQASGYRVIASTAGSTTNVPLQYSVRPTNTSVNFIIKATSIALPSDFASAVDDKIAANIVDSITDGNMKAATSNAVFDALANYKKIGDVFFSNDFKSSGTAPSYAATASHTITIAGTYFVYVSGNPYATDTDMTVSIRYNNANVGFNSVTNSGAANYSMISCVCMVQASVGGVISVNLTGATSASGYNHYGIFRIA